MVGGGVGNDLGENGAVSRLRAGAYQLLQLRGQILLYASASDGVTVTGPLLFAVPFTLPNPAATLSRGSSTCIAPEGNSCEPSSRLLPALVVAEPPSSLAHPALSNTHTGLRPSTTGASNVS